MIGFVLCKGIEYTRSFLERTLSITQAPRQMFLVTKSPKDIKSLSKSALCGSPSEPIELFYVHKKQSSVLFMA